MPVRSIDHIQLTKTNRTPPAHIKQDHGNGVVNSSNVNSDKSNSHDGRQSTASRTRKHTESGHSSCAVEAGESTTKNQPDSRHSRSLPYGTSLSSALVAKPRELGAKIKASTVSNLPSSGHEVATAVHAVGTGDRSGQLSRAVEAGSSSIGDRPAPSASHSTSEIINGVSTSEVRPMAHTTANIKEVKAKNKPKAHTNNVERSNVNINKGDTPLTTDTLPAKQKPIDYHIIGQAISRPNETSTCQQPAIHAGLPRKSPQPIMFAAKAGKKTTE